MQYFFFIGLSLLTLPVKQANAVWQHTHPHALYPTPQQHYAQEELPRKALDLVNEYLLLLQQGTLDDSRIALAAIAGGDLLDEENPESISGGSTEKSLRKDRQEVRNYFVPAKISKFTVQPNRKVGYEEYLLKGTLYKIWLSRKDGTNNKSGYLSVIVPDASSAVKEPKIVEIGNL